MLKQSSKLYVSCQKENHHDRPLVEVCIEPQCSFNQRIGCSECMRVDHIKHCSIPLSRFVELYENLRFSSGSGLQFAPPLSELKELKHTLLIEVQSLRKKVAEHLDQLQYLTNYYNDIEERISAEMQRSRTEEFVYDHMMDLEELKDKVNKAVTTYLRLSEESKLPHDLEMFAPCCLRKTSMSVDILRGLAKSLQTATVSLVKIFQKTEMRWSSTFRHPECNILDGKRLSIDHTQSLMQRCALSEFPVQNASSWAVKINYKVKPVFALGIVGRRKAQKFGYCLKEEGSWLTFMRDLCLLHSHNVPRLIMTPVKRGASFKLSNGDVVYFTLDLERMELICENRNKGYCALEIPPLKYKEDKYHACAFLNEGVEMEFVG